jgi:NAD(P)-dependent dehydrogenase (short-subunit alcohol dehydrogenase family)
MSGPTIALVTGANKGIGYEIAAGLGALRWRVGARDDGRRDAAVAELQAAGVDAFGVPLDVTDGASVASAAGLIEDRAGGSTSWSTTPASPAACRRTPPRPIPRSSGRWWRPT